MHRFAVRLISPAAVQRSVRAIILDIIFATVNKTAYAEFVNAARQARSIDQAMDLLVDS